MDVQRPAGVGKGVAQQQQQQQQQLPQQCCRTQVKFAEGVALFLDMEIDEYLALPGEMTGGWVGGGGGGRSGGGSSSAVEK